MTDDIEDTEEDELLCAEPALQREQPQLGSLYFVQFQTSKRWKIGFTTATPNERLAGALTFTSEPIQLVTHCPGSKADEQHVHAMLQAHRVDLPGRREIFEDCPEVRALVEYVAEARTTEGFEYTQARSAADEQLATLNRVHGEYQKELRQTLATMPETRDE